MFKKLQMKWIVSKVEEGIIYAIDHPEGIFVIDKNKLRVKVQYNKTTEKPYFTIHRLKKDGKHTTFKSWHWTKYCYNMKDGTYEVVREGKYVWNPKK